MYLYINIVPGYRYFWFSSYCRSNCHPEIARHLRRHYQRPAFLPDNSESSNLDWLFMGGFGSGADVHVSIHTIFTWYLELVKDILQENNFHWNFSAWNLIGIGAVLLPSSDPWLCCAHLFSSHFKICQQIWAMNYAGCEDCLQFRNQNWEWPCFIRCDRPYGKMTKWIHQN